MEETYKMENACPTKEALTKPKKKDLGIKDVRFVIAVGSGKGGVGKTTISTFIAFGLKDLGYTTGIFDLDFYGPNLPLLVKTKKIPLPTGTGNLKPIIIDGLRMLSLGFLLKEDSPIFMRGLMAGKLLQELTKKVDWGPLDFLILDLPPGTGDIFLTMFDIFEIEGFILITTPHKLSISDGIRTISILKEKQIPIFGVIKNMTNLFPESHPYFEEFLKKYKLPLIAEIPILEALSQIEYIEDFGKNEEIRNITTSLAKKIEELVFRIY